MGFGYSFYSSIILHLQMFTNINQRPSVLFILLLNLVPIWGVIHWGWTPFYVFYLFWLETLIVSIFNAIKIFACRGDEYDEKLHSSNHKYASLHVNYFSHIGKASRYLLVRIFIFFFYLLFIVTFIGFLASQKTDDGLDIFKVIFFKHKAFNYTLLAFAINQLMQFLFDFYGNEDYKRTHASDFASIFDGRQLVIHVAVVLSGVLGSQGSIFNTKINTSYLSLIMVGIFCVVKSIYEVFVFLLQRETIKKREVPKEAIQ